MKVTHYITTNMRGFQQWMRRHPRKRTDGFFSFKGKELKHEQIKRIIPPVPSPGVPIVLPAGI